jgi:hypothetical protein
MADQESAQEEDLNTAESFDTEHEDVSDIHADIGETQLGEDNGDDAGPEDDESEHNPEVDHRSLIQLINQGQLGLLVLHFPQRDVRLAFDGDSALRVLTMFKVRTDRKWKDQLNPVSSSALTGWCVLDLRLPLAISWMPIGDEPSRTAIDPR